MPSLKSPQRPFPMSGFIPLSSCGWEGKLVATVFSQGCPMRCVFCHNPSLIDPRGVPTVEWETVQAHLAKRRGLIDGVVFSGGEPTMYQGLVDRAVEVKGQGFLTGVHTAGTYPQRLKALIAADALDWVGFDIKASWGRYEEVSGLQVSSSKVLSSLDGLLDGGVSVEARTTLHPDFFTLDDAEGIAGMLATRGITE